MSIRVATAVGSLFLLGACASSIPPPRFAPVGPADTAPPSTPAAGPVSATTPSPTAAAGEVGTLLSKPLTSDAAVRVAFLNNPTLLATFEEIGVSEADLLQASRLANPELSAFVRFPHEGSGRNTEFSLVLNLFDLFARPARKKIAGVALEQTKVRVAHEVLAVATEVKEAFVTLEASEELAVRLRLVREVTAASADFARKQHAAGTIGDLEMESRAVIDEEAKVEVAQAEAEIRGDRERLNRLLGLWGPATGWTRAEESREIPDHDVAPGGLEAEAVARRQDLQAARFGVDLVGRALALKRRTRFFPVGLDVGVSTETDVTGLRVTGPEIRLQLPIFDTGKASIARLEAEHRRAQRQLEGLAVNARSEVREERDRMAAARETARSYRSELLPRRQRILELTLGHYNAMFVGAYDLLLAKRAFVEAEKGYLEAWRAYWVGRARLEKALGGPLPAESVKAAEATTEGR